MNHPNKIFVIPSVNMYRLIDENPRILLMLEHFQIDFRVGELSVGELAQKESLSLPLFLDIANLYNGYHPEERRPFNPGELLQIIAFLTHSHTYYKIEKYSEIGELISQLNSNTGDRRVKLVEEFFDSYFKEVLDHFQYEEKVAFPYFLSLLEKREESVTSTFSAKEYRLNHSDIETKLADVKNLLIRHLPLENELPLRRKLFFALQEFEYDLAIHSSVEEMILMPLVTKLEQRWSGRK
ncbi:MAG: hemerythrin domain-containing protein [Bacteroidales bacterium]